MELAVVRSGAGVGEIRQPERQHQWVRVAVSATLAAAVTGVVFWAWVGRRTAHNPKELAELMAAHSAPVVDAARAEARWMRSSVSDVRQRAAHAVIDAFDDVEDVWDENDESAVIPPSQRYA